MCIMFLILLFKISVAVHLSYYFEYAKVNDSFAVSCYSFDGIAPQWEFNGEILTHDNGFDTFSTTEMTTLLIGRTQDFMFGIYTCTDRYTQEVFNLFDYDKALKAVGCDVVQIHLPCSYIWIPCTVKVTNELEGRFFWTRNENLMINSQRILLSEEGIGITNVTEEDDGPYNLIVLTDTDVFHSLTLQVVIVAPPRVVFKFLKLAQGQKNLLTCTATSLIELHVELIVPQDLPKNVTCRNRFPRGTICEATVTILPYDLDKYNITCAASNIHGNKSVNVIFKSLPIPCSPVMYGLGNETVIWFGNYSADMGNDTFVSHFIIELRINKTGKRFNVPGNVRTLALADYACAMTSTDIIGSMGVIAANDNIVSVMSEIVVNFICHPPNDPYWDKRLSKRQFPAEPPNSGILQY